MDNPIRFRLHQFAYSSAAISTELMLKHSGLGFEVETLPVGDPIPILRLTQYQSYEAPVLEDMFNRQIIFNKGPKYDDIGRLIGEMAPLMILFPTEVEGIHTLLDTYVRHELAPLALKITDAFRNKWMKTDLEAGLHRYQREKEFGVGCLETWDKQVNDFIAEFQLRLQPFENVLTKQPFLTGERPVHVDYVLTGILGTYLFSGATSILNTFVMVETWYSKMRAGAFKYRESELHLGEASAATASYVDVIHDASEIEKVVSELKMRPGAQALDLMTGGGETAVLLATKKFNVTAADVSHPNLVATAELANSHQLALTLKQHGPEPLPYPDSSFNLICVRARAHMMAEPETFVREAYRCLRTYGYLMVVDNVIPDDQVEADQWLNTLERLRDPNFVKYYTPNSWKKWCVKVGLTVTKMIVEPHKQPDLNWYLSRRNPSAENRKKIMEMVAKAPSHARELFKLTQEDGKIVWQFRRMIMLAGKI
jgi:ubiquinone/menaquinone biosynthesis C-methylase UbiE